MTIAIRRATPHDASAITAVHVNAWRWAYGGLLPRSVLDRMPSARREETWRATIVASGAGTSRVWVAERSERIVGFVVTGAPQDTGYAEDTVEVQAIYQLQEVAGTGIGCRMMVRALEDVRACGFRLAVLWVLESNARGRDFYERGGWRADGGARTGMLGRSVLRELRYSMDLLSCPSQECLP